MAPASAVLPASTGASRSAVSLLLALRSLLVEHIGVIAGVLWPVVLGLGLFYCWRLRLAFHSLFGLTPSRPLFRAAPHSGEVYSACFSPDGAKIVSASGDMTVRVWNPATGECELTLKEHSYAVNSACFSPDGAKIVSASSDQ
eukprot:COSAG06_NODE_5539_length_3417_cov_6.462327_1_plen_142_part_10